MNAKLTLRLDEARIERAKRYAARSGKSVSRLVEDYFAALPDETPAQSAAHIHQLKPSPGLQAVLDAFKGVKVPDDYDPKEDYVRYLEEKYR